MENYQIKEQLQDILSYLGELKDQLNKKVPQPPRFSYRSDDIGELATALAKAQLEFKTASKNRVNPYFKSTYADFEEIVNCTRPALNKYGLAVLQDDLKMDDGSVMLITILVHGTNQYVESRMPLLPTKSDVQSLASYNTYLKRMAYASLVGAVSGEVDDDGEAAVATERETYAKGVALNNNYKPQENQYQTVSKDQIDELERELEHFPDICELVLEGLKIQSIADMPKSKYPAAITRIRELVLERKNRK